MKKLFKMFLAVILCFCSILAFSASAFANEATSGLTEEECLERIYQIEIGWEQYNPGTNRNVISELPDESISEEIDTQKNVTFFGKEYTFIYEKTLLYPLEEGKKHSYLYYPEGETDPYQLLYNEDGSIYAILFTFAHISIKETDSPDTVRPLVEQAVKEWVDVSQYSHNIVNVSPSISNPEAFVSYKYIYYNEVEGYVKERFMVSVGHDGQVRAAWIDVPKDNIGKLDVIDGNENKILMAKLREMYNSTATRVTGYYFYTNPYIVYYGGEEYIYYSIMAEMEYLEDGSYVSGWTTLLLVPLSLLSSELNFTEDPYPPSTTDMSVIFPILGIVSAGGFTLFAARRKKNK